MLLHSITVLNLVTLVWGGASNSYADCLTVAAKFATTVTGPVTNITLTTGVNVTCSALTGTACPGSIINSVCTWQRKLSVTCINGSTVRIRIQSNGLPNRCAAMPSTATFSQVNIDFETNFNPAVSVNSPNHSPTTSSALSSIVCDIGNQMSVPSASNYVTYSTGTPVGTLAGVAIDGMAILNVNSANDLDPFYPSSGSTESVDSCLSHCQSAGIYHYHMASGCMVSPPNGSISSCSISTVCGSNTSYYALSTFPTSARNLTVIGIAKDGHVIYGPYLSTGVQVTSGFDICNGMFYDSIGNYGYFATITFPYITGCFGPGNYPNATPNCTTNPASSYTMSSYALSFSNTTNTINTTTTTTTTTTTSASTVSTNGTTTVASTTSARSAASYREPTFYCGVMIFLSLIRLITLI